VATPAPHLVALTSEVALLTTGLMVAVIATLGLLSAPVVVLTVVI
jgi:hypothetical protein